MSDINTSKELYGLYVQRFGNCPRTPYQAAYYRQWLDLLNACSSNEEAQEKSKLSGLYLGGAAAVSMDRVYANKQAAEEMGWTDVAAFCDEVIQHIKADPYYVYTHINIWSDLKALKERWLTTIEGFHLLFADFVEYDDTRSEPGKAMSGIAVHLKMLSKPSSDFATLAALPSFRALIDCSDDYYREFADTIARAAATGRLDTIQWNAASSQDEIEALWNQRDSLVEECRCWRSQAVKPPCIRLSPENPDGNYKLLTID